jgi:2-polyprenyl-6-methoxyphenol hydroxylase-like FAD-dependent oxidoreductase
MVGKSEPEIVIVGGSLAGLTLALACASRGVSVRVIERADAHRQGGNSLSIDLDDLFEATGHDPRTSGLPVVPAYRDRVLTNWPALYAWLRQRVMAAQGVALLEGKAVVPVADLGDRARVVHDDGTQTDAGAVIGADGIAASCAGRLLPKRLGPTTRATWFGEVWSRSSR